MACCCCCIDTDRRDSREERIAALRHTLDDAQRQLAELEQSREVPA